MVVCSNCHHQNSNSAKFCEECATPLARRCTSCANELSDTAKFCPACGTPAPGAAAAPAAVPSAPRSHVPEHLARKILNSRSSLEGERKLVTILFADLKGSMEIIADLDPEEAQSILDPLVELMTEAVHYYEGTVSLTLGDGLMAIFGAPVAHEDHAVRACFAALRMKKRAEEFGARIIARIGAELQIRVGLNSGDVVVRSIGSDLNMDYSAIGQTSHLASRMEQAADPGTIFMAPATKRLVEKDVSYRSVGERVVKGMRNPVEVFEVLGVAPVHSRFDPSPGKLLTSFLGRQNELSLLKHGLARARDGRGQALAISGEAGIGKSRLIWEFTRGSHVDGVLVLEGRTSAYGKSISYAPVQEMLRRYFKIDPDATDTDIRAKVTETLEELDSKLKAAEPGYLSLLGVSDLNGEWSARDPAARRRLILDGVSTLVRTESLRQPVILIFDDLHWIDQDTQEFLDVIVDALPLSRILLLFGYRLDYTHDWNSRSYFREIRVASLASSNSERMLDRMLGPDPRLAPLKQLLMDRTDGNPFFIEESVRSLFEMKFIEGEPGAFRLLKAAETMNIPASAHAILSARIDRLDETDKWILEAASVIGKEVEFALLLAICGVDEETLRISLDRLQSAEFLYEKSLFPELVYTFRHALVQEVAYGSLLSAPRRELHAKIARALAENQNDRSLRVLDQMTVHATEGELWDKAVEYGWLAGNKAVQSDALREAASYFRAALEGLNHLPQGNQVRELEVDIAFDMRGALIPLGDLDEIRTRLEGALTKATEADDDGRQATANSYLANVYWELGRQSEAIAASEAAEEIAAELGIEDVAQSARRYLGRAQLAIGDFETALETLRTALDETSPRSPSSVLIRVFMSTCHSELGEFDIGVDFAKETLKQAGGLGHAFAKAAALAAMGRVMMRRGEFEQAARHLEHSLNIVQSEDIPLLLPFCAGPLGGCYSWLGRQDEGVAQVTEAIRVSTKIGRMVELPLWQCWLAASHYMAGDYSTAMREATRGLELAETYEERAHKAWNLLLIGDIEVRLPNGDQRFALSRYRESLEIAKALKMRPLALRCHASMAELDEKTLDRTEAQEARAISNALGEKMKMTRWIEPPMTEDGVPRRLQ